MPSSPGNSEELPRAHQEDEGVGTGDQVVDHDAEAAAQGLALARGKRLPDVEEAEEQEGRDEDPQGTGQEHHGEHHPGELVDDDDPGILVAGHRLHSLSSPDAQQGDDHEDGQEPQARERDEPERDGGDKTAGSAGRHGRVPGAPAAAYREVQAVGPAYRLFSDDLVAVHLDDADISKASGAKVRITQIDDAVDLRGLPGRASLEGEGG